MNEKTEQRLTLAWKAAGWCLVAASCAFIALRLARTPLDGFAALAAPRTAAVVLLFSLIYSLLNVLLAFAWALLYRMVSREGQPVPFMAWVHLRTGVVKYLPGNVFHLAGRHVLAGNAGAGQGHILAANILEMGIITAVAVALAAATAGTGFLDPALAFVRNAADGYPVVPGAIALGTCAVAAGFFIIKKFRSVLDRFSPGTVLLVISGYVFFFCAAALLLRGLAALASPQGDAMAGYFPVLGVFCISWIAGFVVPGAPGGLGVRESVIVAALSPFLGDAPALAAALLLRAVTVAGDLISFGYSFITTRRGDITSIRT